MCPYALIPAFLGTLLGFWPFSFLKASFLKVKKRYQQHLFLNHHQRNATLHDKIGQMIWVGFEGQNANDGAVEHVARAVQKNLVGGVVLFSRNLGTPASCSGLIAKLHKSAAGSKLQLPLCVSVDQEGGAVQRFLPQYGVPDTPSAFWMAQNESVQAALNRYQTLGRGLSSLGVNVNFGPVVDLKIKSSAGSSVIAGKDRAYGEDVKQVTEYASAFVQAHRFEGMLTCLKHFPGHGAASGAAGGDSHQGLVTLPHHEKDRYLLEEGEFPFRHMIAKNNADLIMTAHLLHPDGEKGYPVTLSNNFVRKRLREGMGFKGVTITDDLHMGAIIRNYDLKTVVIRAIQSGHDILLFSNNSAASKGIDSEDSEGQPQQKQTSFKIPDPDLPQKVIQIVEEALEEGSLSLDQIEASFERILKMKFKLKSARNILV